MMMTNKSKGNLYNIPQSTMPNKYLYKLAFHLFQIVSCELKVIIKHILIKSATLGFLFFRAFEEKYELFLEPGGCVR